VIKPCTNTVRKEAKQTLSEAGVVVRKAISFGLVANPYRQDIVFQSALSSGWVYTWSI
jgi:hypothetical protein